LKWTFDLKVELDIWSNKHFIRLFYSMLFKITMMNVILVLNDVFFTLNLAWLIIIFGINNTSELMIAPIIKSVNVVLVVGQVCPPWLICHSPCIRRFSGFTKPIYMLYSLISLVHDVFTLFIALSPTSKELSYTFWLIHLIILSHILIH